MTIYSSDIAACNHFAQASAANFKRAALFVLATIQQQLETVPVIVSDFERQGGASRFAFGSKKAGLDYLDLQCKSLYRDAMACLENPAELLRVFLRVPGFGLVKAGFLAQIFNNAVGCIDVHNIRLYNVPLSAVRYGYTAKPKTKEAKRNTYVALCDGLGGSAALWSRWCDYVAALRPNNWADGGEVSRFHFDVISGKETGQIVDLFSDVEFNPKYKHEVK